MLYIILFAVLQVEVALVVTAPWANRKFMLQLRSKNAVRGFRGILKTINVLATGRGNRIEYIVFGRPSQTGEGDKVLFRVWPGEWFGSEPDQYNLYCNLSWAVRRKVGKNWGYFRFGKSMEINKEFENLLSE